ncbi:MAG: AAA family ATPase [Gemmatimonadetes bacterium]|nr:AAA family ATPase [Gemmatimonadota bacterium]
MADVLQDTEAYRAPEAVVPKIAFRERTTLLAAPEKSGKSTLVAAAAAAVTQGEAFLGELCPQGNVLMIWLEEHRDDLAEKIVRFGGDPKLVFFLDSLVDLRNPIPEIEREIKVTSPILVVIDSLSELGREAVKDPWAGIPWTRLLSPLNDAARTGPAIVILHHTRKSDGKYRDSSAIGAAVDLILEMSTVSGDRRAREIKAQGRFRLDDYTIRLEEDGNRYLLVGGEEIELLARIFVYVRDNPHASKRSVREKVEGASTRIPGGHPKSPTRGHPKIPHLRE